MDREGKPDRPTLKDASLLDYLFQDVSSQAIAFSHRPGLRRKSWTHAQIARTAFQFARELELRQIGLGDRVVIWAENSPEWVAAFCGIISRGAIAVPLDDQSTADFVQRVCDKTSAKLILTGTDVDRPPVNIPSIKLTDLPNAVKDHSPRVYPNQEVKPDDTVETVFTSGTTAEPKGVVLTHANLLANLQPMKREINKYIKWKFLVDPIKILCLLPLSHVFGQMMGIFLPRMLGAEVILQDRLNPSDIVDTIKRERVMIAAVVPRMLETLRHKVEGDHEPQGHLGDFKGSSDKDSSWPGAWWKHREIHRMFGYKFLCFVTGGATLAESTEGFWRQLGFGVIQGYGMTETAALVSLNNPFSSRRGSLGQILAGRENVRIGENGEILVRGKNISPGYWGEQQKDRGSEWMDTGDVGEMDETGRLYFKGRKKDVIVTAAGLNVYPDDLEAALNAQPEVTGSTVASIDIGSGPEPAAALLVRPGSDVEQVVERTNKSLAPFQQIRRWIEWPDADFPRTSTKKVRKNIVAEFIARELNSVSGANSSSSPIADLIAKIGGRKVKSEARLSENLNLDSLSRVELMSAIEDRYQIDLDERAFTETKSVADIEKLVRGEADDYTEHIKLEYPRWALKPPISWLRAAFYPLVIYPITRLLCRVNVRGLENLSKLKGPVVFASNHITYIDPPLIMSAMPGRFRQNLAIAMDGERQYYYRHPPPGAGLITRVRGFFNYWLAIALFNAFPLPRRSGFRRSFNFAGEAMDHGYNILIFPEGELTKDGSIQKFKSGVGLLANGLEAPVVPLAITGLYELHRAGQRGWAPPGVVTVTFGEPLTYDPTASATAIAGKLEETVRKLTETATTGLV